MAYSFTEEQARAIALRDRTLLVSAAAGSGKTATLTARIIASLTDPHHPVSLSKLVVATFTKASAADMRKKIAVALREAIAQDPKNRRLANEELLLSSARISTIDSFCAGFLRTHAEAAGLSPSFRVADPAEDALLAGEVMEELLEDLYAGACEGVGAEEFLAMADTLSSAKNEADVGTLLHALYEKVQHDPLGIEALRREAEAYRDAAGKPFLETPFGAEVADRYARIFSDIADAITESIGSLDGSDEKALAPRISFMLDESTLLDHLASLLTARDPSVASRLAPLGRLPAGRRSYDISNRLLSELHTEAKKRVEELRCHYFTYTEEEFLTLTSRLADFTDLLYRTLSLFDRRLAAEKRRRNILGFLDITRLVYGLLVEEMKEDTEDLFCADMRREGLLLLTVRPTALAREYARGIDCLYIDEFQDVNPLQYGIFRAIAREDNLFMVGDVKQCIYAFRHSDPAIFSALRYRYGALTEWMLGEDTEGEKAETLFFTRNFRSDGPILRYVNKVAGQLLEATDSTYEKRDELVLGKPEPRGEEPVRTHVFALPTRPSPGAGARSQREAEWVAEEIGRLLREGRRNDGKPITPSDIVLLFETKAQMGPFAEALAGIAPVAVHEEKDFFLNPEVLLALSLFYIVDNPRRDIYLAAALRSPVFGLTMSELVAIRAEGKQEPTLYDALRAYLAAHPDFAKGKRFLDLLSAWRRVAEGETVGSLALRIFHDAGLLTLSGEGTTPYHDNLYRLYQYARSFEASSYRGLYSFISYVNAAIENRATLLKPVAPGAEESVSFMTVHASKGLEFPVVFLVGTDHTFNQTETRDSLLYDRRYGPCVRLLNERGDATENPIRTLLAERLREESTRERIRLLYVALTRARERLYVTGSTTKPEERCEASWFFSEMLKDWYVLSKSSFLSWILPLMAHSSYFTVHPLPGNEVPPPEEGTPASEGDGVGLPPPEAAVPPEAEAPPRSPVADLSALLAERLAFRYPDEALTTLPEKLSVSHLSPIVLDGNDAETVAPTVPEHHRPSVPLFLSGKEEDEAALAGTATHLFMQFCDLDRLTPETVEAEILRLAEQEFLRPEDAARVRRDEVAAFCQSALFARLRAAKGVRRELRFHALLPAAAFAEGEERRRALGDSRLLVQGVIDCVLEEEDGYTVIDYKTDRLTPAECASPALAAKKLLPRHRTQLSYYAAACREMYGKPPREVLLYSLPLGDAIPVVPDEL